MSCKPSASTTKKVFGQAETVGGVVCIGSCGLDILVGQKQMAPQLSTRFERISLDQQAPIARITLHNPPLNVIDIPMMEELSSAIAEADASPEIWTIVLRGAGKCFSAGVDVAAHAPETVTEMLNKFHAFIRALLASSKITVAVVHGQCLGGGAELAMVCDIVITAESAEWAFPGIGLGCFPLHRIVRSHGTEARG